MFEEPTLPISNSPSSAKETPFLRETWGPFRLLTRVGSGGFGEVYRAWDATLEREVALKLLLPGAVDNEEEYAAMLREARAIAAIQHPNIVHVYGIDRYDDRVGFWTDFVKGKTLTALIESQGPMGYREASMIGIEVSRALSAVHRAGLLHRDIKAENVMREDGGRILLMDFGLSVGKKRSLDSDIAGTPNYMAPELFKGGASTVATDIYALGVLIYFLVIGEYPARLIGLSAQGAEAALAKRALLMDRRSDLPDAFLRTVRVAMDLDPAKRFGTAGELAESLVVGLDTQTTPMPVSSASTPLVSNSSAPAAPHRLRNVIVIAAVAVLIFSGFFAPWYLRHRAFLSPAAATPGVTPALAILPIANDTADPAKDALADGFTGDLIRQVSEIPHARVISRASAFRYKGQTVDVHTVGQNLHAAAVMTGTMQRDGDKLLINVELSNAENDAVILSRQYTGDNSNLLAVRADVVRDLAQALNLDTSAKESKAGTANPAAYQAYLQAQGAVRSGAPADIHAGIRSYEQAVQLDPKFALAWGDMADAQAFLGTYFERPTVQMPLARQDVQTALKLDPSRPSFHGILGLIHLMYDWDYPAAATELASADAQIDVFHVLSCSTHLMHQAGKSRHAEDLLHRMQENDPESVEIVAELGCVAYYSRDYKAAIAHYQDAMKLDSHSPIPYWGLGKSYSGLGRYAQAVDVLKQFKLHNGFEPPLLTAEIGYALARDGKTAEAKQSIQTLQQEASSGYVDPYYAALIYHGLQDKEQTYAWLEKAFKERSGFLVSLVTEPKWEDSTSDPRFLHIVERMNMSRTGSGAVPQPAAE